MVRFILKLPSRSHIGQSQLSALNFLNISDRVSQLRLNHVFKISFSLAVYFRIQNGTSPLYLTDYFKPVSTDHNFNTRSIASANYFVPQNNSVYTTAFYFKPCRIETACQMLLKCKQTWVILNKRLRRFQHQVLTKRKTVSLYKIRFSSVKKCEKMFQSFKSILFQYYILLKRSYVVMSCHDLYLRTPLGISQTALMGNPQFIQYLYVYTKVAYYLYISYACKFWII